MSRFEFRWNASYRRAAAAFGIKPSQTGVTLDPGAETLTVQFGRWRLRTPLSNVKRASVTGPYRFVKTAGPPRLGITDRGITFASNGDRGVLLELYEPVPGIDPLGLIRHPNITLTVADPGALLAAIDRPVRG